MFSVKDNDNRQRLSHILSTLIFLSRKLSTVWSADAKTDAQPVGVREPTVTAMTQGCTVTDIRGAERVSWITLAWAQMDRHRS